MYSSRRTSTRATSKKNKTRSKRTYLKFRKMRGGGGMTFEQFITERQRLQNIMDGNNANGLSTDDEEDAFNKLWEKHPEHVKKLSDDLKEETKAKAAAKAVAVAVAEAAEAAEAAAAFARQNLEYVERNKEIEQQRIKDAKKFKELFLLYIPKEPTKVFNDVVFKTNLLQQQVRSQGNEYLLKIPDFYKMTDDKYKDFVELLNNLHNRRLFDKYKAIVTQLYGENTKFLFPKGTPPTYRGYDTIKELETVLLKDEILDKDENESLSAHNVKEF